MTTASSDNSISTTLDDIVKVHSSFLAAIDAGKSVTDAARAAYGWDLQVSDPAMLLAQIDQIVIRGLTSFDPDSPSPVIIDCGANVGISVLQFKRAIPGARITAFEPDAALCEELRGNLRRNGAGDVRVMQAAVWTSTGAMSFARHGGDGGRVVDTPASDTVEVNTVDLRDFLRTPVDLLKLDIEGAEYALTRHIAPMLGNVKSLIVECHIDQTRLQLFGELLTGLRDAGFATTFNTFGHWRDLTRRSAVGPFHFEQYVAVYATRSVLPARPSSSQPYVEFPILLEHYRHRQAMRGPAEYRQMMKSASGSVGRRVAIHAPFTHVEGACWTVRLPDDVPPGDNSSYPDASGLMLFEDETPLGPPHSEHAAIHTFGGGRYSHWHNFLYFSTSDGSDPNRNGRRYTIGTSE